MTLRTIQIDFDIHKLIELERTSFEEPEYLALRRLLKLPPPTNENVVTGSPVEVRTTGRDFVDDGVIIPHGSLARMEYMRGKQVFEGQFLDGYLVVNGKRYSSLSSAASDLATTKDGSKPSLNGWLYWRAKFPNERSWKSLSDLRSKSRK